MPGCATTLRSADSLRCSLCLEALRTGASARLPAYFRTCAQACATAQRRTGWKGNPVKSLGFAIAVAASLLACGSPAVGTDGSGDPAAVGSEEGKYFDKDGNPTYKITADRTVDWYTYSGYRRYHSECHVCHGPDGEGSTYAPALKNSLKRINYGEFLAVVAGGRRNVSTSAESVMPAFGTNPNVMCYVDDLYVYLRARANEAWGRVRPEKREPKPEEYAKAEDACLGDKP
jgi:methanol metabolism-related c-type cytochrome